MNALIKVNIVTDECSREPVPKQLQGLDEITLQNLQTEGPDPMPIEFIDIEYWPEVDRTPAYNHDTHQKGEEILILVKKSKEVHVTYSIVTKSIEDLAAFITLEAANLFQQYGGPVMGGYSELEIKSWPLQYPAAMECVDSGGAIIPGEIALLQEQRGGTDLDCANRILTKASAFKNTYYPALGRRQFIDDLNVQTSTLADKLDIIDNNLYEDWSI